MVATRGIEDAAAFVLGTAGIIDPKTIRVEEWTQIILDTVDRLPINYLRGLRSVRQILTHAQWRNVGEVECRIDEIPRFKGVHVNDVFLDCAEVGDFGYWRPRGYLSHIHWEMAPKGPGPAIYGTARTATEGHILLSRQKKFYYLLVNWVPKVEWSEADLNDEVIKFWYEADPSTMQLKELSGLKLDKMLADSENQDIPLDILRKFHLAVLKTLTDINGQYDRMLEQKFFLDGCFDRIGVEHT